MEGWISIHKKILNWEWYGDIITKSVFLDLLLTANFERTRYRGITIERGQTITGYSAIAFRLGISTKNARTAISHLKSTGEVAVKTTNKFSIITLINYEKYQSEEGRNNQTTGKQDDNQSAVNRQATGSTIRIKEYKNIRKDMFGVAEAPPPKTEKLKVSEAGYVEMTTTERDKLYQRFGGRRVDREIARFENYVLSKGLQKKYKDHYRAMLNWIQNSKEWKGAPTWEDFREKDFASKEEFEEKMNQIYQLTSQT